MRVAAGGRGPGGGPSLPREGRCGSAPEDGVGDGGAGTLSDGCCEDLRRWSVGGSPRRPPSAGARGLSSAALCYNPDSSYGAGWSSPVARRAHNPKVAGSNLCPRYHIKPCKSAGLYFWEVFQNRPLRGANPTDCQRTVGDRPAQSGPETIGRFLPLALELDTLSHGC